MVFQANMMNVEKFYSKYFTNQTQEVSKLFEKLQEKYDFSNVLYPECYIHVTPSFYFPKVVYVEDDETARLFFSQEEKILELIASRKIYPEEPWYHYIGIHFKNPLKLQKESFDLLISLHSVDIREYCKTYLKPGGMLLLINYHYELYKAMEDQGFRLAAVIENQDGYYDIIEKNLFRYIQKKRPSRLKNTQDIKPQLRYPMDYYLFQKI